MGEVRELVHELERVVEGEVRFDRYSRVLYSTDASIYQIEPIGIVLPLHADDVIATLDVAYHHGVPLLPRGGGSSLAGQAVGHAIHIDMSKYMNHILEVDVEQGWVRVQPGVVLDQLNQHLAPHGLQFGPDPASSNRATMGGILSNNSTGAHSILYGRAVDHALEADVVLSDGTPTRVGDLNEAGVQAKMQQDGLEGTIYRAVRQLVANNTELIQNRFPKHWRRSGGYNLDEIARQLQGKEPFNLLKLLVGSEGTFAALTELKLNLVPRPTMTALSIVHFDALIDAMEAVPVILECNPSAVELIDAMLIELVRDVPEYARQLTWIENHPKAVLIVEFYGESEAELRSKLDELDAHVRRNHVGNAVVRAITPEEIGRVWGVRKAGLGFLMGIPGDYKPIPFIEDPAVPVEHLATYIRNVHDVCRAYDARMAAYAHASAGCIHVRPLINLKEGNEVDKMHAIAMAVCGLIQKYDGVMSSEHGDGLVRSEFNERIFGPELYGLFKQVKRAWDPKGIMNPGKVVDAEPMTNNLRLGPKYHTPPIQTHFRYPREGDFARAVEMCSGVGACRKEEVGTMCPSYMATRDEEHSTRGRANALRAALSGVLPHDELTGDRMAGVLDLCLECKGCKAECPSAVDMAKLKYEVLAQRADRYGAPLRSRVFGHIHELSRLGSALAPWPNILANIPLSKVLARWLGLAAERPIPEFAAEPFDGWFRNNISDFRPFDELRTAFQISDSGLGNADIGLSNLQSPISNLRPRQVVLFHDTFMTYNQPSVGQAAVKVLEATGYRPILVERRKCCGRPMISKGLLKEAKANAEHNINLLAPYAEAGIPIIGVEPSCLLTLRDEYPELADDPRAGIVAENSLLIEEFIAQLLDDDQWDVQFNGNRPERVLVHGHCHQKALAGTGPTLRMLRLIGCEVEEVDSGCCGMAGSFGFEAEHYDISMKIGELRLLPAVRAADPTTEIAAAGISCRQQIAHGTGRTARHPIEILADALA
ncbi:MAG: FAD-binding and (Fe-S)-binding domain-containing protein [Anaerolineae bacterium]